jgi:hypothetical protein
MAAEPQDAPRHAGQVVRRGAAPPEHRRRRGDRAARRRGRPGRAPGRRALPAGAPPPARSRHRQRAAVLTWHSAIPVAGQAPAALLPWGRPSKNSFATAWRCRGMRQLGPCAVGRCGSREMPVRLPHRAGISLYTTLSGGRAAVLVLAPVERARRPADDLVPVHGHPELEPGVPGIVLRGRPDPGPVRAAIGTHADQIKCLRTFLRSRVRGSARAAPERARTCGRARPGCA